MFQFLFENDVNMYGIQTQTTVVRLWNLFENDVNMYGIQTGKQKMIKQPLFENDVNMYGIQTLYCFLSVHPSLRMM